MQCLSVDPHPGKTDGDYKVIWCVPRVGQYLWCHEAFAVIEKRDSIAPKVLKSNDDRLLELKAVCASWCYGGKIWERSGGHRAWS